MGKIVAIGGGELRLNETIAIDKFIVEFSEALNPKLLFIPTASKDAQGYVDIINKVYGEQLGCQVEILLLVNNDITEEEIERKILSSDIIYVGGGDTVKMMDIWRRKKVDKYLRKAYENNIVLAGLSAGSICWFIKGHADSNTNTNEDGWWDYKTPLGIGLIHAINCPHYNKKGHEGFDEAMKKEDIPGIAIEDSCAIVIKDNMYKIIKSHSDRKAYLLKNINGVVNKIELNATDFFTIN